MAGRQAARQADSKTKAPWAALSKTEAQDIAIQTAPKALLSVPPNLFILRLNPHTTDPARRDHSRYTVFKPVAGGIHSNPGVW